MASEESEGEYQFEFSDYVDEYKTTQQKAEEYRKTHILNDLILPGMFMILSIITLILTFLISGSNYLNRLKISQLTTSLAIVAIGIGIIVIMFAVKRFTRELVDSHELDEKQVTRHYLACSIESYQNSDLEEALNYIENLENSLDYIAHPEYESVASDLVSARSYLDEDRIEMIVETLLSNVVENDRTALATKSVSSTVISSQSNHEPVSYREIVIDGVTNRLGSVAVRIVGSLVLSLIVFYVYFFVSQGLAGVLAALGAGLLGVIFPAWD